MKKMLVSTAVLSLLGILAPATHAQEYSAASADHLEIQLRSGKRMAQLTPLDAALETCGKRSCQVTTSPLTITYTPKGTVSVKKDGKTMGLSTHWAVKKKKAAPTDWSSLVGFRVAFAGETAGYCVEAPLMDDSGMRSVVFAPERTVTKRVKAQRFIGFDASCSLLSNELDIEQILFPLIKPPTSEDTYSVGWYAFDANRGAFDSEKKAVFDEAARGNAPMLLHEVIGF